MSGKQTPEEAWAEFKAVLRKELEPPLLSTLHFIDRQLRRWPWLYRKLLGGA